jgi:RNA polymerase sigma-70 factor (ECF subfamily)
LAHLKSVRKGEPESTERYEATDALLAERSQNGDHMAYGHLVKRHQDVAFRTAFLVTRSAADAEDAAQDGFVKAYLKIGAFDTNLPFRPWLLTIVANEARNRRRSEGRRLRYEANAGQRFTDCETVASPEGDVIRAASADELAAAVNRLPDLERLMIGLRYFLELTEAETATVAGIPRGTVKSRISRAMTKLREEIGAQRE